MGLIGFLIFSLILTVATLLLNKTLFGILVAIDVAILALVLHILIDTDTIFVGVPLLIVSALSFYGAAGGLLNNMTGKTILPMGAPLWKPK
jgi:succinate-acetate transporter protein